MWRDYAGDLNLYTIPQHERELMYISALLLRWYRNTAEHEREQMGEDKWWEGVENTGLTYMHLKVTDKRQGKDNEVYIYECKNTPQKLVDIVDQVLLQNDIVAWGGNIYIVFRPAWKPGSELKIYGSAAALGGIKNYRLSQLAGQLMEGTGAITGEEQYAKKIVLNTESPPMAEVTLGIDKVFVEGGGCMPMKNKRVNPDSVMGLGNVVTGGTVVTHPEPRTSPMPVLGAHLADIQGWLQWLPYLRHWGHQTRKMYRLLTTHNLR